MVFEVLLHKKATKEISRLDAEMQQRIKKKLKELREYPKRGKPLKYSTFWSLRVGKYRAIYEVDVTNKRVIVLYIDHRDKVYSDFSKLV